MAATLIILGVIVFSLALRTINWKWSRKAGAFGFLLATYLTGYFISDKIWVGFVAVSLWFAFPWVELLSRTRRMRQPVKRSMAKQPPPAKRKFPELSEITADLEEIGFEYLSDNGWNWEGTHHFLRFFYQKDTKTQASICFTEQDGFSWTCVNLTSRHQDGRIFRSINLPVSTPMMTAPHVVIRRDTESVELTDYLRQHHQWIQSQDVLEADLSEQHADDLLMDVEKEIGQQISHNVETGIIYLCEKAETWRYSWRGLIYLYWQVVKDFLRWC